MSTSATVLRYPQCDIHLYTLNMPNVEAHYDAKTNQGHGPWANMCESCFQSYGIGLGTGKGQRLVLDKENTTT